ncbi:MAG: hypothetical protein QOG60_26, partial [Frankiaceae bacterium]|nr:hypothetical protein [Frankiaceae bacterium]
VLLRHEGATARIAIVQALNTIMLVTLLLFLVPRYWLAGAGLAWLVTHLVTAVFLLPTLYRRLRLETHA